MRKGFTFIFPLILISCKIVPVQDSNPHDQVNCQTCHQSPPTTGLHEFHLFIQKRNISITCADCHGLTIEKNLWDKRELRLQFFRDLAGYQDSAITPDSMRLSMPWVDLKKFLFCEAEMRGDTLYFAETDSTIGNPIDLDFRDSLVDLDTALRVFPIDSFYLQNGVEVRKYKPSSSYSFCQYKKIGNELYQRFIGAINQPSAILLPENYRVDFGKKIIFAKLPDTSNSDTMRFELISPLGSFLENYSSEKLLDFSTFIGKPVFLLAADRQFYQLKNDSLFIIYEDSLITYGTRPFALTTGYHGNGKIDIHFRNEKTTLYKETFIKADINPLTGDTISKTFQTEGAWIPRRKSCWSYGIYNGGGCHAETSNEVPWYNIPKRFSIQPP